MRRTSKGVVERVVRDVVVLDMVWWCVVYCMVCNICAMRGCFCCWVVLFSMTHWFSIVHAVLYPVMPSKPCVHAVLLRVMPYQSYVHAVRLRVMPSQSCVHAVLRHSLPLSICCQPALLINRVLRCTPICMVVGAVVTQWQQ